MKRREKLYSIDEDLALDARMSGWSYGFGPSNSYYKWLIKRLEEYDPGGKRAHEIAGKIGREQD